MNASPEERKHPLFAVLVNPINRLSDLGATLSALIFSGMVLLILAEVVLRNFMGSSTEVSDELAAKLRASGQDVINDWLKKTGKIGEAVLAKFDKERTTLK